MLEVGKCCMMFVIRLGWNYNHYHGILQLHWHVIVRVWGIGVIMVRNCLSLCPIYIISGTFCIPIQSLFSGSGRVVL